MAALIGGAIAYAYDPALGSANSLILAGACAAKPAGTPTALVSPAATTPCPGQTAGGDNDSDDTSRHAYIKAQAMQPTPSPTASPMPNRNVTVTVQPVTQVNTQMQTAVSPAPSASVTHVVIVQTPTQLTAPATTPALPRTGGSAR